MPIPRSSSRVPRLLALLCLACGSAGLGGQEPADSAGGPPAAGADSAAPAAEREADSPPIGLVEFFGLRTMPEDSLRAVLGLGPEPDGVRPGTVVEWQSLPLLAARLAGVEGVAEARFETVCCHRGRTILFVGVREEEQEPLGEYWPEPDGAGRLPDEILAEYRGFLEALSDAVQAGRTGDDLSRGHSLVADSLARSFQLRFPALAEEHLVRLRDVLAHSSDPAQRAVAAAVIGYAPDKGAVAPDLVRALRDPDPGVRNNAARSLAAIAVYAKQNPDAGVTIPVEPLAEMLQSVVWTDRNKALSLLTYLTPPGGTEILPVLRREAFPALVEMAGWRSPGHALPAFVLLGRMAGLSDEETLRAWQEGRQSEVIERARNTPEG